MSQFQDHSWPRIFGVFATGVAIAFLVGKVLAAAGLRLGRIERGQAIRTDVPVQG